MEVLHPFTPFSNQKLSLPFCQNEKKEEQWNQIAEIKKKYDPKKKKRKRSWTFSIWVNMLIPFLLAYKWCLLLIRKNAHGAVQMIPLCCLEFHSK